MVQLPFLSSNQQRKSAKTQNTLILITKVTYWPQSFSNYHWTPKGRAMLPLCWLSNHIYHLYNSNDNDTRLTAFFQDNVGKLVLFFSHPRSKGWPHHGRTYSIYLYPLSFWLTLPQGVLSTSWCCLSRSCIDFLAYMHLALFLELSLSPCYSLVSSWYNRSKLASLLL